MWCVLCQRCTNVSVTLSHNLASTRIHNGKGKVFAGTSDLALTEELGIVLRASCSTGAELT